jgi:hypothetical protein
MAAGGVVAPDTKALVGVAGVVLPWADWKSDVRFQVALMSADAGKTSIKGGMLMATTSWWWGVYGLGVGSGFGYADLDGDGAGLVAPFSSPVQLAFGRSPRFEVGLTLGAMRIFTDKGGLYPWGFASVGLIL